MRRNFVTVCLIFVFFLGVDSSLWAERPSTVIQPAEVLLPLRVSQAFQLLGSDGNALSSSDWSVSDPAIAELKVEGGRAFLTAKAVGSVTLRNGSGAQTEEILIHNGEPPMPAEARWILHPIDGSFVHAVWASGTWGGSVRDADPETETSAAYFYEDRGAHGAHVRAIRTDGLQAWQWPPQSTGEVPRMLCGDFYGGVLVYVGDKAARVLISLDADGKERWRAAVPGFGGKAGEINVALTGTVFVVEEDLDRTAARIVALDGHTGAKKHSLELQPSRESVRNLAFREGKAICSPGAESSKRTPVARSGMMTNGINKEGISSFAYSELSVVADGGDCKPGTTLSPLHTHLRAVQRLLMVDITDDLIPTISVLEETVREGDAATTWIETAAPTGDIIVGDTGTGNFLAVRRSRQHWRAAAAENSGEFQYRVTDTRAVKYRFAVSVRPDAFPSSMLLGENNKVGYTTRGKTLVAFNTETAQEIWRWESEKSKIYACAALQNDSVIVREGDGFTIVKSGKTEAHLDKDFMLFVMKFVPNLED